MVTEKEIQELDVRTQTLTFPSTYTIQKTPKLENMKNIGNNVRKGFFGSGEKGFKNELIFYLKVGDLGIDCQEAITLIKKGMKKNKKEEEEE